ncbi:ndufa6 NADH-ubiquinone oxidoreductase subunit [Cryptotrichosporon argae]
MTTIPSRLAKAATTSHTIEQARRRSIQAYRQWYRSAPEICALYALNVSPSAIRLKIRQDFEKNRAITDLSVIDILLHKNQQEYQETMNCWKQEPHLMHWFKRYDDPPPPQTFLDKFYAGRDDPKQVASF